MVAHETIEYLTVNNTNNNSSIRMTITDKNGTTTVIMIDSDR